MRGKIHYELSSSQKSLTLDRHRLLPLLRCREALVDERQDTCNVAKERIERKPFLNIIKGKNNEDAPA